MLSFSGDGRYVVYSDQATNLVANFVDGNGTSEYAPAESDVYEFDRVTGINMLMSRSVTGPANGSNGPNSGPEVSGDGRFVTFSSTATDLVAGTIDDNVPDGGGLNVYISDRVTGKIQLVSHALSNALLAGDHISTFAAPNQDGSVVAFTSDSDDLVANDFNDTADTFLYVTPPARVQSLQIADGSVQRSTIRSLTVTFDQAVTFAGDPAAAFEVTRVGTGDVSLNVNISADGTTATVTFSGPLTQFGSLIDGNYQLTIHANQVTGYIGNLDGDGDGVAGGDYTATFFRLFGDANGDRHVDAADFLAFRLSLLQPSTVFDYDGSGSVDAADFLQFRLRFLQSI